MTQVTLTIDGQKVAVEKGTTIIQAAESIGIDIPRYCYHPGLSIDGNCRMCLVEVAKIPKPMTACSTPASDGMEVQTQTEKVLKMRRAVMEFQLVNHPLDCPTCDQAGECSLQDYYMQHDQSPSRLQETKVRKNKMIDLGSNVMLDQERCIACSRCVRFCKEVAGVDELALANRGDHVMITTFPGRGLTNRYAGNVVDVCPVGALTNKDFRYKKRVWFLSGTDSICPGCSRGCNIRIDHEKEKVYRLVPRFNKTINKYWMCDEGRYGYQSINENRILKPHIQINGQPETISLEEAIQILITQLSNQPLNEIAVVAHAQETNETLKALADFAKNVLETNKLYYSRREVADPVSDDFLMTADKNPNQKGVDALGFKPLEQIHEARGVLVLGDLSESDRSLIREKQIPILALWASNESETARMANVVFPIPTYAEQVGHFTNVDGVVQKINRAFAPRGEAVSVCESLAFVERNLGAGSREERAAS